MNKIIAVLLSTFTFFSSGADAQNRILVFDEVLFYDGYATTVTHPVPSGVIRHRNDLFATKLTEQQLQSIGDTLGMLVIIKAACDNYDRIGNVNLAFVPKGATSYDPDNVERIEIARFITPFMNKNIMPDTVPFRFRVDNVAELLRETTLRAQYDIWAELEVFGVPYAANNEVFGCANRNDVFYGTLIFETGDPAPAVSNNVLLPLSMKADFNNYNSNATDEVGKTEKTISLTLSEDLVAASLYLITSNHGANSGGEEYNRRNHFVFFNGDTVLQYRPGRPTCEPFRKYNTQGNGIYGPNPRTDAQWQSFSNWCPGDVIDIRHIDLGPLQAGTHTFRITVPAAVFAGGEGNFPLSLYLHGKNAFDLHVDGVPGPETGIKIFPNPAGDILKISSGQDIPRVHICNTLGQKVFSGSGTTLDVSSFSPGIYVIHVRLADGSAVTERFLKR